MVKYMYMYPYVHIYPCLIFLCEINVVIKIRKNELLFRWTINLALKTAENMFYADTPFDSEDLVEVIDILYTPFLKLSVQISWPYQYVKCIF